jgi:hypothetical protein
MTNAYADRCTLTLARMPALRNVHLDPGFMILLEGDALAER